MPESSFVGRRTFLKSAGIATVGSAAASAESPQSDDASAATPSLDDRPTVEIELNINGKPHRLVVDSRTTLVDLLRENLAMFGTKKGCDHGACGACTVHQNGRRVLSCLTLAATLDGADIRTIEGLSSGDRLHPMQEAFLRCDAYQCGYCTPGQIMSAIACIDEGHAKQSVEETREWMSGNLCRCSAYPNIVAAVRQTAGAEPRRDPAAAVTVISNAADKQPNSQAESGS